ncbi:nuclear transport factor 2 family protein [Georgenia sp. H159]|uniref:nuclear transport factor 2 family protein n=1 Tax=Georgenia sp. H159 TaxID=3076115 RepID=UPI002D77CF2B|nr:nuclear transport factor 2 family protein [Georgenia sp. H159]
MSATDPAAVVAAYYTALRAGDVESWLAVFSPHAEVTNPAGTPPVSGPVALRELWEELTCPFRGLDVTEDLVRLTAAGAAVKWTVRGVPWAGEPVSAEGIDVFETDGAGRIITLSSYWDPSHVRDQLCRCPSSTPDGA